MRSTAFRPVAQVHEQRGQRYAVVLRPAWLALSAWTVAFTSTTVPAGTVFRPSVEIAEQRTLVMCDQLVTVDLDSLAEPAAFLSLAEMQRVAERCRSFSACSQESRTGPAGLRIHCGGAIVRASRQPTSRAATALTNQTMINPAMNVVAWPSRPKARSCS